MVSWATKKPSAPNLGNDERKLFTNSFVYFMHLQRLSSAKSVDKNERIQKRTLGLVLNDFERLYKVPQKTLEN